MTMRYMHITITHYLLSSINNNDVLKLPSYYASERHGHKGNYLLQMAFNEADRYLYDAWTAVFKVTDIEGLLNTLDEEPPSAAQLTWECIPPTQVGRNGRTLSQGSRQ